MNEPLTATEIAALHDPDEWYEAFIAVSGDEARTPEGRAAIYDQWRAALRGSSATLDAARPSGKDVGRLEWVILDGGLRVPNFDHWRERATSKPSDPDDIRWDCSCGYAGSPETVRKHWVAMRPALDGRREDGT